MPTETEDRENARATRELRRVAVWDLPTRLFHWTLVVLFVALWITGTSGPMSWHLRIGELVLAMLAFRLVWGAIGSRHSRFADFVVRPAKGIAHLREIVAVARSGPNAAAHDPHVGHTRLGGWMIVALLTVLLAEAITGLFATDDVATDGPLFHLVSERIGHLLTDIHSALFNLAMALAIVHIGAAFFYLLRKRENLIWPLVTGRALLPPDVAAREGRLASPWLALAAFVLAAILVRWVISL